MDLEPVLKTLILVGYHDDEIFDRLPDDVRDLLERDEQIKVGVEVIFTPLTYFVVRKLKQLEGEDYYDRDTNFNPFIIQPPKF